MTQVEQQEEALQEQEQALAQSQKTLRHTEQGNQKLTCELALLKGHAFSKRSEQLKVLQISLLEEVVNADIAAIGTELEELNLTPATPAEKQAPKRAPLPKDLLRIEIRHDSQSEHCACGCQLRRIAEQAIDLIGPLYQIEREAQSLTEEERQRLRDTRARPIADTLRRWMLAHREKVPNGSATAKALDYSLKRWAELMRSLDDGGLPIDNNRVENLIRPWTLGRSNWLFAGSLRSGQRAATVMSLIQCARLNGHEPYSYLKDVLERLSTQKASQLHELLPQNWQKPA